MRYAIREVPSVGSWSASSIMNFDFQSILNEFRSWSFPCIQYMAFRYNPTFTTGSSGGVPRILPQQFATNVLVTDVGGQRVNLRGSSLAQVIHSEQGLSWESPAATTTSQTTAQTGLVQYYPIPVMPTKGRRRRDYSLPVSTFIDGGSVQLTTGPATAVTNYYTMSAATISLVVKIVEEGQPEAKSRFLLRDQAITSLDYAGYIIGGFLRSALIYNGEVNDAAATSWTAGGKVDSYTLNLNQCRADSLRDMHLYESKSFRKDSGAPTAASVIIDEDGVVTGQVIPLLSPAHDQKITDMVQASTLHIRLGGNITTITTSDKPQLITSVLEERNPVATQRIFKRSDISTALSKGRVKTANGNRKTTAEFPVDLVNVLPVKLDEGK